MDIIKVNSEANKLYAENNYTAALNLYRKMLTKCSIGDTPVLYYNIGLCHFSLHNYPAAEKSFQRSFNFGYKTAGYELSMSKLFLGKLEEGLNLYNYRYWGDRFMFPRLPIPMSKSWDNLVGKKILVLNEQGLGDELLFSRSIRKLSEVCQFSKYQVYQELYDVFVENFSTDKIEFFTDRSFNLEFVEKFDYWIPSGDLFVLYTLKYGFDYQKIKCDEGDENNIGVCWYANKLSKNSHLRSVKLEDIALLKDNYKVFSLQKGENVDWMINNNIETFKDTLNIINNVDKILSIDTSVFHLAMLTGKKTYLLYNDYLDWRWLYPFYNEINKLNIRDIKNISI